MFEKLEVKIKGVSPLILHSNQTADPLNEHTKAIKKVSSVRKKTDKDHEQLAELEWRAALYVNDDGKVIVPGDCIKAMLIESAKKQKLGKAFKPAVFCFDDALVEYDGPKNIDKLYESGKFISRAVVKVMQARIVRTRPIFHDWKLTFTLDYLPTEIDVDQVKDAMITAGRLIGLCDWRPVHGRFEVESFTNI